MCEIETGNLIDFSAEDETAVHLSLASVEKTAIPSNALSPFTSNETLLCDFNAPAQRRDSFDNNPFDMVQKLADRPTDPFELVEKQARHHTQPTLEVKVGKLLSLSNDDILAGGESTYSSMCENTPPLNDSTKNTVNALMEESPPLSMKGSESGSASSTDSIPKKAVEQRKRLLKLSISNSTFNSPVSRRAPSLVHSTESGFSSEEHTNSPLTSMFQDAAAYSCDHMLSAESPLKLVDDDISSEATPECQKAPHSEFDFAADLEMLKLPILRTLPSPDVEEKPLDQITKTTNCMSNEKSPSVAATLPSLEALRKKLSAHRLEQSNNREITSLIENLKTLICDSNMADKHKKQRASSLLETLSSTLAGGQSQNLFGESLKLPNSDEPNNNNMLSAPPQPIKRQGTFDVDLPDSGNTVKTEKPLTPQPDAMISSTATYDGDSAEDKEEIIQSEVDTVPITQPLDLHDIVEQLSKLLGQQHIASARETSAEQADQVQKSSTGIGTSVNPTFIVVMNAPTQLNTNETASLLERSFREASAVSNSGAQAMRRRSQSLSLHDKLKIVQLPMPVLPSNSPTQTKSPTIQAPKTPIRLFRRNSYSSGTPYTPITNYSNGSRRSHG